MGATAFAESASIATRARDVNGMMRPCRMKPPMMRCDKAAGYNWRSFTRHSTGQWISR